MIEGYTVSADGAWTVDNVSAQERYVKAEIVECTGKDKAYIENNWVLQVTYLRVPLNHQSR